MDKSNDEVRRQVSEAYTRAVEKGCGCGPGCCGEPRQKGVAVRSAGYDAALLESLPPDAVENSFGCGDPVGYSDLVPGETVLDLGCGAGIDLLLAAEKVGPSGWVIGVDMTEEMLTRARRNIETSGYENVEVRRGFIEDLPVADGSVDVVISNCVINLSPDKPRVFGEIARVLAPGGRMKVSDLVAEGLPDWVREDVDLYSSCVAGAISEAEYVQGLQVAGLEDVRVEGRLVYDLTQLRELLGSELPEGGGERFETLLERAADELGGRVASVSVTARKPG